MHQSYMAVLLVADLKSELLNMQWEILDNEKPVLDIMS